MVVATVRRPGMSIYDSIGLQDMTTDDIYFERGINMRHGYLSEYYVEDHRVHRAAAELPQRVGVLLEPLTVAEKGVNQAFEIQRRLKVWQPREPRARSGTVGLLATLALRLRGIEVTCISLRPAPYRNSDLIEEIGARYVSTQETSIRRPRRSTGRSTSSSRRPASARSSGTRPQVLAKNGVLGAGERDRRRAQGVEVPADWINQAFVLGNKVMVGTVNASPDDFARGCDDLVKADAFYPGWLGEAADHAGRRPREPRADAARADRERGGDQGVRGGRARGRRELERRRGSDGAGRSVTRWSSTSPTC